MPAHHGAAVSQARSDAGQDYGSLECSAFAHAVRSFCT